MLPGYCEKLSRAACARRSSVCCSDHYFATTRSVSSSSSAKLSSPSLRSFHCPDLAFAAAVDRGTRHDRFKYGSHFSRKGVFSTVSHQKLHQAAFLPGKMADGSAAKLQRLFSRMFSSLSKRGRAHSTQRTVVVADSPAKAKTLQWILGPDFLVLHCHNNVRTLAAGVGSVRTEENYELIWEVQEAAQPHIERIKNACMRVEELVLATNPDREGEALAWHVAQLVARGIPHGKTLRFRRLVLNQVTKKSVLFAMQALQRVRLTLVHAHLAKYAIDHLSGFSLSPLLWIKLSGSQCAGRLHLCALKLIYEREKVIREFVPQEFWRVETHGSFEDDKVSILLTPVFTDEGLFHMTKCSRLAEKLTNSTLKVSKVFKTLSQRDPLEPYTTSTVQEDAQDTLGFEAELTMSLAQKLYEGVDLGNGDLTGLITYPFTDEAKISKEAATEIQRLVTQRFGNGYVSSIARLFESKVKDSLEINEGIRPSNMQIYPSALSQTLDEKALALYTLIWKRSLECQMAQAVYEEVFVDFVAEVEPVLLRGTFRHLAFQGFLATSLDKENLLSLKCALPPNVSSTEEFVEKGWNRISGLKEGDVLIIEKAHVQRHSTSGPGRYTEGQLVNAIAKAGFGRPFSYASILKLLKAKTFVRVENGNIIPEVQGLLVMSFLSHFFPKFVDCESTVLLGKQVNEVSVGRLRWKKVLREFWPVFNLEVSAVMKMPNEKVVNVLHEVFFKRHFTDLGFKGLFCPRCGSGKLFFKENRSERGYEAVCDRHPLCRFKVGMIGNKNVDSPEEKSKNLSSKAADILLGVDPTTNLQVTIRAAPWGTYIQRGDERKGLECFKIPHGIEPGGITLKTALSLMKYPVELGKHPEDGVAVILGLNYKSLYCIKHKTSMVVLSKKENPDQMTLEKALKLLEGKANLCGKLTADKGRSNRTDCV